MLFLRLAREDRDGQTDRELDTVLRDAAWDNVSLLALDHALDALERLGRVEQDLSQAEVIGELLDVLRRHEVNSLVAALDVSDLQNLRIVAQHVWGHLEGRHVDDVDVGVLRGEDSADLRVLTLKEFVH